MNSRLHYSNHVRAASVLDILSGLWLAVSPFVIDYGLLDYSISSNDHVMGMIIVGLGIIRLFPRAFNMTGVSWYTGIIALWVTVSPWVLGYAREGAPATNNFFTGVFVLMLAVWSYWATDTYQKLKTAADKEAARLESQL